MNKLKTIFTVTFAFLVAVLPWASFAITENKAPGEYYYLSIGFNKDDYSLREVSVTRGNVPDRTVQPEEGFRCDVVSVHDEILNSFLFQIPNVVCSDNFGADGEMSGGCVEQNEGNFSLEIPYFPTGRNINIYDNGGRMVLLADISEFARLCGDGVCHANESFGTCPQDCKSGIRDGYCDKVGDGVCDSDCPMGEDVDCVTSSSIFPIILAIIALAVLAIMGFYVWQKVREAGKDPQM